MNAEQKLEEMGLEIPTAAKPLANYVTVTRSGNLLFLAGHLPLKGGQVRYTGKIGGDLTIDDGYEAARLCALNCLASIKSEISDLDRIGRILKVVGFISSAEGFTDQPKVLDGASDLLAEVFSDAGKHARSAVGVYELPANAAVEVEMIVEVKG